MSQTRKASIPKVEPAGQASWSGPPTPDLQLIETLKSRLHHFGLTEGEPLLDCWTRYYEITVYLKAADQLYSGPITYDERFRAWARKCFADDELYEYTCDLYIKTDISLFELFELVQVQLTHKLKIWEADAKVREEKQMREWRSYQSYNNGSMYRRGSL